MLGVAVHRISIRPWRFDDARNAAMALIPADVDVCCTMDMDRFLEPGWRAKLEAAWAPETAAPYSRPGYRTAVENTRPVPRWAANDFHHSRGERISKPVPA